MGMPQQMKEPSNTSIMVKSTLLPFVPPLSVTISSRDKMALKGFLCILVWMAPHSKYFVKCSYDLQKMREGLEQAYLAM